MLRLSQGISSVCYHATSTPKKFRNCHYCGMGSLCFGFDLAKVFLHGATMLPLHPFFRNCHYCGEGALCFCFNLARVFLQGANTPPLHQFFPELSLSWEGCLILLLRLSQGISSGCHHATPTPKQFSELSLLWDGAICFCFDLAKVFPQGFTMPPLHPNFIFFGIVIITGRGIMLLLRLSQGISSGCQPCTNLFRNCHYRGKGALSFCFDLAKVFHRGATMPPPHQTIFGIVIIVGWVYYLSAST